MESVYCFRTVAVLSDKKKLTRRQTEEGRTSGQVTCMSFQIFVLLFISPIQTRPQTTKMFAYSGLGKKKATNTKLHGLTNLSDVCLLVEKNIGLIWCLLFVLIKVCFYKVCDYKINEYLDKSYKAW